MIPQSESSLCLPLSLSDDFQRLAHAHTITHFSLLMSPCFPVCKSLLLHFSPLWPPQHGSNTPTAPTIPRAHSLPCDKKPTEVLLGIDPFSEVKPSISFSSVSGKQKLPIGTDAKCSAVCTCVIKPVNSHLCGSTQTYQRKIVFAFFLFFWLENSHMSACLTFVRHFSF